MVLPSVGGRLALEWGRLRLAGPDGPARCGCMLLDGCRRHQESGCANCLLMVDGDVAADFETNWLEFFLVMTIRARMPCGQSC